MPSPFAKENFARGHGKMLESNMMLSRLRRHCWMLCLAWIMLAPNALAAESLPKITASRVKILENLRMARFDTLDAELSSYEKKAEQDPRYEMNAIVAFGAFECGNSLIASGVDNWVKAHPDSYAALTAKATCYIFGAQRRIEFWPSKPNEEEAAKFLAEGARDATEAIKIDQDLAPAYALKIKAARLSRVEQDKARARDEALSIVPWSFAVREQIMYALLPKWGGSQSQMQQFADSSQYYEAQNPALQFLKAWVPLDQGDEFFEHSQLPQALDQYTQAVQAGGEYWTSYRRRARAYYAMHEWQKAVDDAAHSNALYPDNSENLRVLAFAAYRLNNPEASILYLGDLLRFEMPDPETAQLLSSDQALLKSQGKENW